VRLKVDENVTTAAVPLLAEYGHDVDTVPAERLTGATDATLIEACRAEERMLVTFDVGFGDVRTYPPQSHPGIVLLRIADQRPDSTLDVLRRFLASHSLDELHNALVVVSDDRVRIRRTDP
jgi:predicted nuclease of predicted toxin-antitoxin system